MTSSIDNMMNLLKEEVIDKCDCIFRKYKEDKEAQKNILIF